MCYSDPAKSLSLARERMTPEQWAKFEADFEHFCAYSGLLTPDEDLKKGCFHVWADMQVLAQARYDWAKWAYLCGKGL